MLEDRPSLTAAVVAFARGVGLRGEVPDPIAQRLLPAPVAQLLAVVARAGGARAAIRPAVRTLSLGMVDHVTLRTHAIDEALRAAIARGLDQLVILGAGLDARAWRMPELERVDVFEVDHPATQAYKRAHCPPERPLARSVELVAVDFERQRVGDRLAASGHDASRPTFWIWEGVTMYLERVAVIASLGEVTSRSAVGSEIAVTYLLPDVVPVPALEGPSMALFRGLGEPLHGALPREEMLGLLTGASFVPSSDTCSIEWARAHGTSATLPMLFRKERLAIGVRREPA